MPKEIIPLKELDQYFTLSELGKINYPKRSENCKSIDLQLIY